MKLQHELLLPENELINYANRYRDQKEDHVISLVSSVKERGFMTKDDLIILGNWKSPRIKSRIKLNSDEMVQDVTRLALETNSIQLAIHIPMALNGVGVPVSSTILHWFHPKPFPILDFRALWTLGIEKPSSYSLESWDGYVKIVREIASAWNTDMRTLDRALWQYSAEHQK